MRKNKIVQFVCFETTLDTDQFMVQWERYNRSSNIDHDVTLQQSQKNGHFRYIAQHRCATGEFQFDFSKAGRSSRTPEVGIKVKQAGGYSVLQMEKDNDVHTDESKVFVFLINAQTDLNEFRQLSVHGKLNIYEAYFENCQYAYILEYFTKNKYVEALMEHLKPLDVFETGAYKECLLQPA